VLVIVFTCNHCPTAQAYEDRLIQLTKDYSNKGVAVAAIMPNDPQSIRLDELGYTDMGDSFAEMKRRAARKHFNFPYLYDGKTEAVDPKWQGALPYTLLVEPGGKIVYAKEGPVDPSELKKTIVDNHLIGRYY
jgi:glutathione peroxidase-family protein